VWWKRYLESPEFRLQQEVEAYQVQFSVVCRDNPGDVRRQVLRRLAKDLSGPMYGHLVQFELARALIVGGAFRQPEEA